MEALVNVKMPLSLKAFLQLTSAVGPVPITADVLETCSDVCAGGYAQLEYALFVQECVSEVW